MEMDLLERLFGSRVAEAGLRIRGRLGGQTGVWPGIYRRLRRDR